MIHELYNLYRYYILYGGEKMSSEVSERLQKVIKRSGLSYREVASRTGIPQANMQRYAVGKTSKIPVDVIEKVASVTNSSALYILGYEDTNIHSDNINVPLYSELCCGRGIFIDDEIEDYISVPNRYLSKSKQYFANLAKGDSMEGKDIFEGDTLIFEKTNIIENGQIGSFCINGEDSVCKIFRKLESGMILLESANPKYEPIIVDVSDECFRVVGKLVAKFSVQR